MSSLRTRPPSGRVAFPLLLLEGEEKAGKSVAAYRLSASPKVGRTFVFDLGEGTADEYGELGPYEIVEHNGTFTDLLEQMRAACAEPMVDGCPNVVVLDDATALWDLLKDWAGTRARNSRNGRKRLAEDPDAEVDVSMNLWNDAKDRWYAVVNLLRSWPGIGVLIARGKEVAKVQGGQPVAGETEWKVDAEKGTAFAASAWVRMTRPPHSHPHRGPKPPRRRPRQGPSPPRREPPRASRVRAPRRRRRLRPLEPRGPLHWRPRRRGQDHAPRVPPPCRPQRRAGPGRSHRRMAGPGPRR